jgi:hypothetical protein
VFVRLVDEKRFVAAGAVGRRVVQVGATAAIRAEDHPCAIGGPDRLPFVVRIGGETRGEAALQPIEVVRERGGKNLDGDVASEPRIARAIDLAHAARADERDDFIRTEASAGREGHVAGRLYRAIAPIGSSGDLPIGDPAIWSSANGSTDREIAHPFARSADDPIAD